MKLVVKFTSIIGFGLAIIALVLAIVTFVIPEWIYYEPNSSEVPSTWIQYQRKRGLFQECMTISQLIS